MMIASARMSMVASPTVPCSPGMYLQVYKTIANPHNLCFQLYLGDFFKDYELAQSMAEKATGLISWINNHRKVWVIMDKLHQDCLNKVLILAYLMANLTCWTTHCTAFIHLLAMKPALHLAVIQSWAAIVFAEVGAATGTKERELAADTDYWCEIIDNGMFWEGLEHVVSDLELICYTTNIDQKDSTHADTILLSLVGKFLHFAKHPIKEVAMGISKHIKKR